MDIALFILRLVMGITFLGYGSQKLFGWFGGYGLTGTGQWMESLGLKPGKIAAFGAGASEIIGGLLLLLGVWTGVGAALIILTMIVAIATVHGKNGYWNGKGGFEYNLLIIAAALVLALAGPGSISL
ncbi:DoxX family membrane protein [Bacillus mangrovi]|uniref:DoxX family membrane protein n=1 Tax=Metabacillus mangrovi TaxID=1491830 RepID=A0A7X2S9X7_9BACI|nr:DoxX family protein [Metabacillus mangrovi]MTH55296.1 DoxX family membrane protein [Metabacillus mangrovi]